jgi:hypothetical protein
MPKLLGFFILPTGVCLNRSNQVYLLCRLCCRARKRKSTRAAATCHWHSPRADESEGPLLLEDEGVSVQGYWRKICTLRQAHSKPNKLASHAKRFQDVPVHFPWKLTKDKVVKFQSLELAGWYQTVPYLRPEKPCGMTYSYRELSANKLETIRELQSAKTKHSQNGWRKHNGKSVFI